MKSINSKVLVAALALTGSSAFANLNLNVEGKIGPRWSSFSLVNKEANKNLDKKAKKGTAVEYGLGMQYQVAELPVSVGGEFALVDWNKSNRFKEPTTSYGLELALSAKAWVPAAVTGIDVLKPYVKVGYVAYSNYVAKGKSAGTKFEVSESAPGFQVRLGSDVKVMDNVSVTAEYAYASQKTKGTEKATFQGVTAKSSTEKGKMTSHSVLVGAQVNV